MNSLVPRCGDGVRAVITGGSHARDGDDIAGGDVCRLLMAVVPDEAAAVIATVVVAAFDTAVITCEESLAVPTAVAATRPVVGLV